MKVLILESNPEIARVLAHIFVEAGYVADVCENGWDAIAQASTGVHDLIVLDWTVRDIDRVSACRVIRRAGVAAPILLLTTEPTNQHVIRVDVGADNSLTHTAEFDQLLGRARALVLRASEGGRLRCGELEVDTLARRVTRYGQVLSLREREFALLSLFAKRVDQIVTRADLKAQIWSVDCDSNVVDVTIARVREKLGSHRWMLETVRGQGYRLRTTPALRVAEGDLSARVDIREGDSDTLPVSTSIHPPARRIQRLFESERDFIVKAACELRSPLTTLYGSLDLALRKSRGAEEYRSTIEDALHSARRLNQVVEQLLRHLNHVAEDLTLEHVDADKDDGMDPVLPLGNIDDPVHGVRGPALAQRRAVEIPTPQEGGVARRTPGRSRCSSGCA
jgi:DNA-binding response OmpR family regulator